MSDEERRRRNRESARRSYANKDKAAHAAYMRAWRAAHPDQRRQYVRTSYDRNYDGRLRYLYGIGQADYDLLLVRQGGVCAICGGRPPEGRRFHVDHDHATDQVRGLLCGKCNTGIGHFEDDVQRIASAATYLASHMALL